MIKNLVSNDEFAVMVNAMNEDGFPTTLALVNNLPFMEAADYAINAQGYFTYALLERPEWSSVQIEIGSHIGTIQLIEIKR